MPILFLLFVLVPIVEIALLIQVGGVLGVFPTLAIVVATAALGTWLLRHEGLSTLAKARSRLDSGELPALQMIEGMVLLVGGALLLTPGFMTDAFGFFCLLPPSRRWLAGEITERINVTALGAGGAQGPSAGPTARPSTRPGRGGSSTIERAREAGRDGDIIEGEWQQVDRED